MSSKDDNESECEGVDEAKDIQAIHEIISEALLGASSNTKPLSSGYTLSNFESDRLRIINSNDLETLEIGKLYLKFKDLDSRLTRVEEIIYKNEDFVGQKRTTTLARSDYSTDPCYIIDQGTSSSRLSDFTSINPILTSSADILSISSFGKSESYAYSHSSQAPRSISIQKKEDIKVIFQVLRFYIFEMATFRGMN